MSEPYLPGPYEVETHSGRFVDLFLPLHTTVDLEDVAHHLSRQCRFNGAPDPHYSIAEHCCLVAEKLRSEGHPELVLPGLHHDDDEYVLGDQARPLKGLLRQLADPSHDLSWDAVEEGVARACWQALAERRDRSNPMDRTPPLWRFADQDHPLVKAADTWAALVEARAFMPSRARHWTITRLHDEWDLMGDWAEHGLPEGCWELGLPADAAKQLWLAEHRNAAREAARAGDGVRPDVERNG